MDITDRLKKIRKDAGLTQRQFAESVMLSQSTWAMIECGSRRLTDKNISLICEKFGVNEAWLRDGVGEPYTPKSEEEELAEFFGDALDGPGDFRRTVLRALSKLNVDQWEALADLIDVIVKERRQEQQRSEGPDIQTPTKPPDDP